ncbi:MULTISPECIES: pentapeptide repeat-containing protein [unclassified Winogradskyella]|uniref:pentapeptide repeat-containing protein n=1 Tax=unclassified Winogradskyella TaxID=2615021 RepID=UPI001E32B418|nr:MULTISPECIES: pentapeptide repeat-containing protein [unclassified Winogradskyella]
MLCKLVGADFTDAQAKKVLFKDCDLQDAIFSNTNLEQANFISAYNFNIIPSPNQLKKALFSRDNLSGLLQYTGIIIKS